MKVTWNWLREFVDLDLSVAQLAERLTMAGLEVESIETTGGELAGVVCAELVRVHPHPQADRLSVCEIRPGGDTTVKVVCGATNLRAGDRVAYAAPGSSLPDGKAISTAEVRGVSSAGMLCSEAELGVGPDASGILILPNEAAIGERVAVVLGLEDTVLDVGITPNRGDCLSILGIAREIAALTGQRLRRLRLTVREADTPAANLITITIADPDLCSRYVGRILEDVKIAPSPLWMQSRLRAVGMRPLNNIVDVTNYVMLERGQPLHAFDYDRLPDKEITVRRAGGDQRFTTLDGQLRTLAPDDLLITSGNLPVAIAGIMGGADTEVTDGTRRVLLESAWFAPSAVRRTARRLGLRSEASYRFERTTDIDGVPLAADRAAALSVRLSGASVARDRVDTYPSAQSPAPISLRLRRVDELSGMTISRAEVTSRLKSLGLAVSPATGGSLTVVPPSYRSDLTREIDVIEEIVRLGGYENVPTTLPECGLAGSAVRPGDGRQRDLKRLLTALGLHEAVLLTFCSRRLNELFPGLQERARPVTIVNPITTDEPEMRLSVCPGLIRVVRDNLDQGAVDAALFCLGKVFWRDDNTSHDGDYKEGLRLGAALSRKVPTAGLGAATVSEFVDIKGIVEAVLDALGVPEPRWLPATDLVALHPGKTARIEMNGRSIGLVGSLHPSLEEEFGIEEPCWIFELDLDPLLEYCPRRVVYKDLPRFPMVVRDLAVVSEEGFASDQVIRFVKAWSGGKPLIEDVLLFDQYAGPPIPPGKKSLAYSISYRAQDRTLTDAEVNDVHARLIAAVRDALHLEPR
jgi:phenylalanyl-tRNA synthetase beta chain